MASCLDIVHHEENLTVSCKNVKKQGSLRCYMLSALIVIVETFHALHSLCVTLISFALLWWNMILYATCAKYYPWNRLWLRRLQTARRCFYGGDESCSFIEVPNAKGRQKSPFSLHQRGSNADALHSQHREMSILPLHRVGACSATVYAEKRDVSSISYQQRKLLHHFGVCVEPFPHQSGSRMLDRYAEVASTCLEEPGPHHLNQFEDQISCDITSLPSKAQAIASSSQTSKLSSLRFLEGRVPEASLPLKGSHLVACSFLLPHQVPLLKMPDVHHDPRTPVEYSCWQVNFYRNGNALRLKVPMLQVSINSSMLREWLQIFNGGRVLALVDGGKKYPENQVILSTTEGLNIFNTSSSYDAVEGVKFSIGDQWHLSGLSGLKMKTNTAYVDDEGSGSDSSEHLGRVCWTSFKSQDECDCTQCTGAISTRDKDDGLQDSGTVYDNDRYGDDGYCFYNCCHGYEDSGIYSVEDAEGGHGSFFHGAFDKGDSFYERSTCCDAGYDDFNCVMEVGVIRCMDTDAADDDYNTFDGNFEKSGGICGDFHLHYEDGMYGKPLEKRDIHEANSDTWWDEDAVLIDTKESEVDSIDHEWQVV